MRFTIQHSLTVPEISIKLKGEKEIKSVLAMAEFCESMSDRDNPHGKTIVELKESLSHYLKEYELAKEQTNEIQN